MSYQHFQARKIRSERQHHGMVATINISNFFASIPGNLGTILYLNGRGCLYVMSVIEAQTTVLVHHLHHDTARKPRFYRDSDPVFVEGFQNLEHGQHLGDSHPHRRISKVSTDTYASTESVCNVFDVIGFERTIVIEESLGYERVWVGVPRFVMCHRPIEVSP